MSTLVVLGTASAIPDENQENTHLALAGRERLILIDCVSNPVVRLKQAGLDLLQLSDLILTHFHPDHVSGVPSLLMNSWLLGRKKPLRVYGLAYTLDRMEKVMEFYDWATWPNFFPVEFIRLPAEELTPVLEDDEFKISASPVCHLIPTIGLRIELKESERTLAYSCDTEPCDRVVRLANRADILIHESTGAGLGHSSAAQAGEIARQAEVDELYLIHYHAGNGNLNSLVSQASETFGGPVTLTKDLMKVNL